jgi:hypothetical protein
LASGVTLSRARSHNAKGRLEISVLRVHLRNRNVHLGALHGGLSTGHRLSDLARGRHVVAATNGMYFNTSTGGPKVPFVAGRHAVVLTSTPEPAAGVGTDHRAQAGHVWLRGEVRSGRAQFPLSAVNPAWPIAGGISVYTPTWGGGPIAMPSGARTRTIRHGRIASGMHRTRRLPAHSRLLVARGAIARDWLRSLSLGWPVVVSAHVETDAPAPFAQAYGTGTQVVAERGVVRDGLYCRRGEVYAARTAIGWRDDGHRLLLVTVESPRGPDTYGVDENQMSALMVALGVDRGYALDGGSSTELLARLPTVHRVKLRSRIRHRGHRRVLVRVRQRMSWDLHAVARGYGERRIPVGIGIYSRHVHKGTHWHTIRRRRR